MGAVLIMKKQFFTFKPRPPTSFQMWPRSSGSRDGPPSPPRAMIQPGFLPYRVKNRSEMVDYLAEENLDLSRRQTGSMNITAQHRHLQTESGSACNAESLLGDLRYLLETQPLNITLHFN